MFPVSLQLMEITPDANVTAVLNSVTTYTQTWVAGVTTWLASYVPVVLPVAGAAIAIFLGVRIMKRLARG